MGKDYKEQIKQLKRGVIELFTEKELENKLRKAEENNTPLRVKLGLDPTSPDIHLGHTVVLRKMRQFQDAGHKAVLIIGDYTARIGDPTGQNTTRPILTDKEIEENARTYFQQAEKILDTSEEKLEVRHNNEWLAELKLADIIKLTSNMTVARMLERDTFELRYKKGDPIGIHEFLYPLMQGYDSVMIKSDIELGGTDQTFNNLIGRDLQRINAQPPQVVMTMPILVGLDGTEKMSKSKGNYIGVTDDPVDMFGKLMSIPDELMDNYFTLLTDLSTEQIKKLTDPSRTHPRKAKAELAERIVTDFHSKNAAENAKQQFDKVFAKKELPDDIPCVKVVNEPVQVNKLLLNCKLVSSGGEGKRMIKQSAVSINGEKMKNPTEQITPEQGMIIKVGKRKFAKLVLDD
jgi:tyrosyl-tRNA synthetase